MKHLLTTLGIVSLLVCTPAAMAQAVHPDSTAPNTSDIATSANPADSIVPLYPENAVHKKLKLTQSDSAPNPNDTGLRYKGAPLYGLTPYRLISSGKAVLVFSGLSYGVDEETLDFIVSSSKDGSKWDKISVAIPRINLPSIYDGVGVVYDSFKKTLVLFYSGYSVTAQPQSDDEYTPGKVDKFYISVGKGSKFTKPKDITRQFKKNEFITQMQTSAFATDNYQGLCLTQGASRGRLIFIARPEGHTICSIYSDDHGRTWKVGSPFTFEHRVNLREILPFCEARNGTILAFLGRDNANGHILKSNDGGISWSTETTQQEAQVSYPAHRPSGYIILNTNDEKGTNSRLLALSQGASQTHVAISYDWGLTWPHQKIINSSLHSSPTLLMQPISPGELGMVTSSGDTNSGKAFENAGFTSFSISWLTDGRDDGIGELKTTGSNASATE